MPTTPGYADVSIQMKLDVMARPCFITLGVKPTGLSADAIATAVRGAFNLAGSILNQIDSSVTVGPVTCRLGIDGLEDQLGADSTLVTGGRAGTSIPPNTAVLCIKRTARGGRRGKGRMYLPWVLASNTLNENGAIPSTNVTTLQTAVTAFLNNLTSASVPMYVLHGKGKPTSSDPTGTGGAPNLVSTITVDPLISTQRRRLGR